MPWKEVKPMEQRVLFVADWIREIYSFSELCQRYGVSRKTGYKWIKRFRLSGFDGLNEVSRKPGHSPSQTPYPIQQAIIEYRRRGRMILGPKKIQVLLQQRFPSERPPSKTTIYKILNSAGMVEPRRRKRRVTPFPQPFSDVADVNDVWSADYKGQFRLQDKRWCYPLTVMDHQSRFLLGCQALDGPRFTETQCAFRRLFQEYGLPKRIRTDNGVPFASTTVAGLSRLAIWWIKLGILPERIEPGKPQQNGRHERMHRTLKQAATKPPAKDCKEQQICFDQFVQQYNQERPHESLGQKTPASQYQSSPRVYTDRPDELTYPDYFETRAVHTNGTINCRQYMIYVGEVLKGNRVGLCETDEGIWDVYFGPVLLGRYNERDAQQKSVSYLTLKV